MQKKEIPPSSLKEETSLSKGAKEGASRVLQ